MPLSRVSGASERAARRTGFGAQPRKDLLDGANKAYVRRVITLVRLARVLLILLLAAFVISFIIGIGSPETGALEKVALLALIAGCVALAAKVSTFATRAQERWSMSTTQGPAQQ